MLDDIVIVLSVAAALGCGIIGGTFFAFSTFIMTALRRTGGIRAMQEINRVILRSAFIPVFMGSALLSFAAIVLAVLRWNTPGAAFLLAGGAAYLAGSFLVTVLFNVPRNNRLDAADEAAAEVWDEYLRSWTAWNHVRTAASLAAAVLFTVAALYSAAER